MAILKCKMCGGDLNVTEGSTVCVCEYCDTKQTVPSLDDEKKIALFTRANRLRLGSEFDKAYSIYETILIDYPEESEAYWGLVLCKYGIEYVDDPATAKKVPTCHRSSFESIFDDQNYELTIEYSDLASRTVYREEAKSIEEIRKGIIEISSKEDPYDIFICYKETDHNGDRTIDSVIAQDVYDLLTNKGYRVFFSRISLEDKLGKEYEPYIFSALHSSKIMLAFGTDYEYFNAVWVKNEWSRFLKLIEKDKKKTLIPCYKNIDAYDMPKEFAKLQAQDMGKIGAMQDLLRGIEKILPLKKQKEQVKETVVVTQSAPTGNMDFIPSTLKKAKFQLVNGEFKEAYATYQKVLDFVPNHEEAIVGSLLSQMEFESLEDLSNETEFFQNERAYKYLCEFASKELKEKFKGLAEQIMQNNIQQLSSSLENGAFNDAEYYAKNIISIEPQNKQALIGLVLSYAKAKSLNELMSSTVWLTNYQPYKELLLIEDIELNNYLEKVNEQIYINILHSIESLLLRKQFERAVQFAKETMNIFPDDETVNLYLLLAECKSSSIDDLKTVQTSIENAPSFNTCIERLSSENKTKILEAIKEQAKFFESIVLDSIKKGDFRNALVLRNILFKINPNNAIATLATLLIKYEATDIESLPYRARNSNEFYRTVLYGTDEIKTQLLKHIEKIKAHRRKNRIIRVVGIISIVLIVALSIAVPLTIYLNSDKYIFGLEKGADGSYIVTEYNGRDKNVKIPEKATQIAYGAFKNRHGIESVELHDNVKVIDSYAFSGCSNLKEINIPKSVVKIGYGAFEYCSSLKVIRIPKEVVVIESNVFLGCKNIKIFTDASYVQPNWSKYWNYTGFNSSEFYSAPVYWNVNIEQ